MTKAAAVSNHALYRHMMPAPWRACWKWMLVEPIKTTHDKWYLKKLYASTAVQKGEEQKQ